MAEEKTTINEMIHLPVPTEINEAVHEKRPQNSLLQNGTELSEDCTIISHWDVESGEADLYFCNYKNVRHIAKIYRRDNSIKEDVLERISSVDSPYIIKPVTYFKYHDSMVEVLPFMENGNLSGKTFSEEELQERIIPDINEGLKVLHEVSIIHKDIKPSNIVLNNDGKTISLIDFGISSVLDSNSTVMMTKIGMTPIYSAPETFRGIYYKGSDYYSLGIVIYELYCGYLPYSGSSGEEIQQYQSIQRIPLPDDMPERLKNLIIGLTYPDITNRDVPDNPNKRWGYDEVLRWCLGENPSIPGETGPNLYDIPAFTFCDEEYNDIPSLTHALAENWTEGKKELYRGNLWAYFSRFDMKRANICRESEEAARKSSNSDDIQYFKMLYGIYPEMRGLYWKGKIFESLSGLGRCILEELGNQDMDNKKYYEGILSEKVISQYLQLSDPQEDRIEAVEEIEDLYRLSENSQQRLHAVFRIGYLLSGLKTYQINGVILGTIREFYDYLKSMLDSKYEYFRDICHNLIGYEGDLDPQLEAWLEVQGKTQELLNWREMLNE